MVTVFCLLYIVGLLSILVMCVFLPRWPPWLAMINTFMPWLFAPLILLFPLALLARSKEALAGCLGSAVLFAALYGPRLLPRIRPPIVSTSDTLSVMTFNLGNDSTLPDQLKAILDLEQADIVALQEYSPNVVNLLHKYYPYIVLDPAKSTCGLLSRYPIVAHTWFELSGNGRPVIDATLDVRGKLLHVLAIHLHPPNLIWQGNCPVGLYDQTHVSQVKDLARRVTALEGSVLILGDFNMNDQGRAYGVLSKLLRDAYRKAGWGFGFTFPNRCQMAQVPLSWPVVRIDYIFHSDDLSAEQARTVCQCESDHCYVVAQLSGFEGR